MGTYPKPDGWKGGPDGSFLLQGSAGHLGVNPKLADDFPDRMNASSGDIFGGTHSVSIANEGDWDPDGDND